MKYEVTKEKETGKILLKLGTQFTVAFENEPNIQMVSIGVLKLIKEVTGIDATQIVMDVLAAMDEPTDG